MTGNEYQKLAMRTNDSKGTDGMNAGAGAVTGGSGVGQQAANYACNFVGNPYKFGGTSLTNGTDCSGFTQAVYAHFGISLPRDSYSQRSCGTEVSYANAHLLCRTCCFISGEWTDRTCQHGKNRHYIWLCDLSYHFISQTRIVEWKMGYGRRGNQRVCYITEGNRCLKKRLISMMKRWVYVL